MQFVLSGTWKQHIQHACIICKTDYIPCAMCLYFSKTGNVNLVWWAWPIAELASVALSVFFFIRVRKKEVRIYGTVTDIIQKDEDKI